MPDAGGEYYDSDYEGLLPPEASDVVVREPNMSSMARNVEFSRRAMLPTWLAIQASLQRSKYSERGPV